MNEEEYDHDSFMFGLFARRPALLDAHVSACEARDRAEAEDLSTLQLEDDDELSNREYHDMDAAINSDSPVPSYYAEDCAHCLDLDPPLREPPEHPSLDHHNDSQMEEDTALGDTGMTTDNGGCDENEMVWQEVCVQRPIYDRIRCDRPALLDVPVPNVMAAAARKKRRRRGAGESAEAKRGKTATGESTQSGACNDRTARERAIEETINETIALVCGAPAEDIASTSEVHPIVPSSQANDFAKKYAIILRNIQLMAGWRHHLALVVVDEGKTAELPGLVYSGSGQLVAQLLQTDLHKRIRNIQYNDRSTVVNVPVLRHVSQREVCKAGLSILDEGESREERLAAVRQEEESYITLIMRRFCENVCFPRQNLFKNRSNGAREQPELWPAGFRFACAGMSTFYLHTEEPFTDNTSARLAATNGLVSNYNDYVKKRFGLTAQVDGAGRGLRFVPVQSASQSLPVHDEGADEARGDLAAVCAAIEGSTTSSREGKTLVKRVAADLGNVENLQRALHLLLTNQVDGFSSVWLSSVRSHKASGVQTGVSHSLTTGYTREEMAPAPASGVQSCVMENEEGAC